MGYQFKGFFVKCENKNETADIMKDIAKEWPTALCRTIDEPFIGIGVSMQNMEASNDFDKYERDLVIWSKKHPNKIFINIIADCNGGNCIYSGYSCKDGKTLETVKEDRMGLTRLFLRLGVTLDYKQFFKPLERGFFE